MGGSASRSVVVVQNFDTTRYLGVWWERARLPNPFQDGKKAKAIYSKMEEGGPQVEEENSAYEFLKVENSDLQPVDKTDPASKLHRVTLEGKARKPKDSTEGVLQVKIGNAPFWGDYQVIDTDYENYALIYSRVSFLGITFKEFAWVLERAENPTTKEKAEQRVQMLIDGVNKGGKETKVTKEDFLYTGFDGGEGSEL
ncbi:unnamed protein product [Amoebophrya sp. A120]|nr:unnamed protein product [Amoebophrya sp. A120]|eukprot:GSA120T00000838001.1